MSISRQQVLNQLSEPQRKIGEILRKNWSEVKKGCKFSEGGSDFCPLDGEKCRFEDCPLLEEKAEKEKVGGVNDGKSSL